MFNFERFNNLRPKIDKKLNEPGFHYKIYDWAEKTTGIPKFYIFIAGATFIFLYLMFGCGAQLLCNVIGVAYPAYISIHAIESSTKADDTKWLIYWVTYAVLSIIEYFSVILTKIIPFYWLLKCIFLVWCMLPIENNGSIVIYQRIVRPNFLKHHNAVDKIIDDTVNKTKNSVSNLFKNE